ncbi:na+ h+ exchanger 1 [Moniliophthora roreri]|nr:na+ h+ exchanger 1 [Moniliophthora roreri]
MIPGAHITYGFFIDSVALLNTFVLTRTWKSSKEGRKTDLISLSSSPRDHHWLQPVDYELL